MLKTGCEISIRGSKTVDMLNNQLKKRFQNRDKRNYFLFSVALNLRNILDEFLTTPLILWFFYIILNSRLSESTDFILTVNSKFLNFSCFDRFLNTFFFVQTPLLTE